MTTSLWYLIWYLIFTPLPWKHVVFRYSHRCSNLRHLKGRKLPQFSSETKKKKDDINYKEPKELKLPLLFIHSWFYIKIISINHSISPVPVAARSNAQVCGRSYRCIVCCDCGVLLGRGLCDELVSRPEESYRLWCVVVCDLETS